MYVMLHHGLRTRMLDGIIPEGYLEYARSEGLDPESFFQRNEQKTYTKNKALFRTF
jgi:hypothetical protein